MKEKASGLVITDDSKRTLQLLELLRALKIVKTDAEFANKFNWHPQNLTALKNIYKDVPDDRKRNIPSDKVYEIIKAFHIKHSYFKTGLLPIFDETSEYRKFNEEIKNSDFLRGLVTDYKKAAPIENKLKNTPRKMAANAKLLGDLYEDENEEFGEETKFRQISPGIFRMKVPLVTQKARKKRMMK